jgi:hypothetical protein
MSRRMIWLLEEPKIGRELASLKQPPALRQVPKSHYAFQVTARKHRDRAWPDIGGAGLAHGGRFLPISAP